MGSKHDVIIVGLGLAGLSAAHALRGRGLDILILDENNKPGGQYLRSVSGSLGIDSRSAHKHLDQTGRQLIKDLDSSGLSVRQGTQIVGQEADGTIWAQEAEGRIVKHQADHLILATGARECFMPFPGWTLPGVISTGAAQILIKSAGMLPGQDVMVGGSGPLPLAVAGEIAASGGRLKAYWNQSSWSQQLQTVRYCRFHLSKVFMGARYMARLLAARTPVLHSRKILKARGDKILEEVELAKLTRDGRIIEGSERTFVVDCLAVGYGFVPNLELAMLAGCEIEHDRTKGGWIVQVDDKLQSSVPSIFAAGELTGIAGADKSVIEGSLAGLSIAVRLGVKGDSGDDVKEISRLQKRRRQEMVFGALLNDLSHPPPGMILDLPDPTMICRCEDIDLGGIREQIRNGSATLDAIKKATNSGMGKCQGRTCGPIIQHILDVYAPESKTSVQPFTVRNPIKPVSLSALADADCEETS